MGLCALRSGLPLVDFPAVEFCIWPIYALARNGGPAVMQEYARLKELVEEAADDVAKASGGNKAAGTRVRKSMQDIKEAAQTVRKKILEVRSQQPG